MFALWSQEEGLSLMYIVHCSNTTVDKTNQSDISIKLYLEHCGNDNNGHS